MLLVILFNFRINRKCQLQASFLPPFSFILLLPFTFITAGIQLTLLTDHRGLLNKFTCHYELCQHCTNLQHFSCLQVISSLLQRQALVLTPCNLQLGPSLLLWKNEQLQVQLSAPSIYSHPEILLAVFFPVDQLNRRSITCRCFSFGWIFFHVFKFIPAYVLLVFLLVKYSY